MSEISGIQLRELLPSHVEQMESSLRDALSGDARMSRVKVAWRFLGEQAFGKLSGALNLDVFGVLAGAWGKVRELLEYADPSKHPPAERSTVVLGEHEFTHTLHPVLDIHFAGESIVTLRFDLDLNAQIESVALAIENGRIVALGDGKGSVSAQLKYAGKDLHKPLASRKVALYGSQALPAPGVAIV